jgi:hypothetical protein
MVVTRRQDGKIEAKKTLEPVAKLARAGAAPGSIIARVLGLSGGAKLQRPKKQQIVKGFVRKGVEYQQLKLVFSNGILI